MNGFYRQLTAILKKHGYRFLRQGKGDHEIWGNEKVSVPVDKNTRSRHTANAVLKQLGLKERLSISYPPPFEPLSPVC